MQTYTVHYLLCSTDIENNYFASDLFIINLFLYIIPLLIYRPSGEISLYRLIAIYVTGRPTGNTARVYLCTCMYV